METYSNHIPVDVMLNIAKDCGENGMALYWYYHTKPMKWNWVDSIMANDLGWSVSKLRRTKECLKEHKYIFWFKHRGNVFMYIGPEKYDEGLNDMFEETGKFYGDLVEE